MKEKMRKALFLMAFLALSAFAVSENWYICLASFMHEDKADALISALDGKGIPAVKSEFVKPTGEKFFRILFAQLFPNLTKAQLKRDNLRANPAVLELGLDGLWCCRVSDIGSLDNSNPPESEKQVILVLINGVPYKRLEIDRSDNKLIKVNINIDRSHAADVPAQKSGASGVPVPNSVPPENVAEVEVPVAKKNAAAVVPPAREEGVKAAEESAETPVVLPAENDAASEIPAEESGAGGAPAESASLPEADARIAPAGDEGEIPLEEESDAAPLEEVAPPPVPDDGNAENENPAADGGFSDEGAKSPSEMPEILLDGGDAGVSGSDSW